MTSESRRVLALARARHPDAIAQVRAAAVPLGSSATHATVAAELGVSLRTFRRWMAEWPEFRSGLADLWCVQSREGSARWLARTCVRGQVSGGGQVSVDDGS